MAEFNLAFERTVTLEGGYSDHPDDPGGRTFMGLTERDYPELWHNGPPTPEQVKQVFKREYWDRLWLTGVNDQYVADEIFDTAINCGHVTAAKFAQRAVNALGSQIKVDGIMGPLTLTAINRAADRYPDALLVTLNSLQCARYVRLTEKHSRYKKFFLGWVRHRVQLDPRPGAG